MTPALSAEQMAAGARYVTNAGAVPGWRVPQRVWEKDFPGQVTDGRIGAPRVRMVPLEWLDGPTRREVRRLLGLEAEKS